MGRVLTNKTTTAIAAEASLGVLPGSPVWYQLEPNDIPSYGGENSQIAREPISQFRQRRKGIVSDRDSAAEIEHDLTLELANIGLLEAFVFAVTKWPLNQAPVRAGGSPYGQNLAVTSSTVIGHDALSAAIPVNTLVYLRGFSNAANNGLKLVTASTTTTTTIGAAGLVVETPSGPSGARMEIAGRRAATSDLELTVTGTTGTLESTVLDFTTLGIRVGQTIHIGGLTSANWFGATNRGYVRVLSVAANLITFDKADSTLVTDAGTGDTVDLLYGGFIRNVATTHADYVERSYQAEVAYPNLQVPGPGDEYEYSKGNLANELALALPLTDKATVTIGFVGTDTEDPTTSRKTNAATPVLPVATAALSTTSDIARLRIERVDGTGLTSCFTDLNLTLNNQVSPEKCLGTLGAVFMNFGNFLVDMEAQLVFTDSRVVAAIRANTTLTMDLVLRNSDGALAIDLPAMTLGDGSREFPLNESVKVNLSGQAFGDPALGYSLGLSTFAAVPLA
jgi:hypothetical protein